MNNMKKQSSIDILVNAIYKRFGIANCGDMEEEIQQAKQMHKQEIIDAHESGVDSVEHGYGLDYYNETFKS